MYISYEWDCYITKEESILRWKRSCTLTCPWVFWCYWLKGIGRPQHGPGDCHHGHWGEKSLYLTASFLVVFPEGLDFWNFKTNVLMNSKAPQCYFIFGFSFCRGCVIAVIFLSCVQLGQVEVRGSFPDAVRTTRSPWNSSRQDPFSRKNCPGCSPKDRLV